MAAEYIMARGNGAVILCERGIRTFETATRNTLDLGAVPVLRRETHLPVVVDPSHAAGRADLVAPLAFAAIAAGADGILVEVHPDPAAALSDGDQSLDLDAFDRLMTGVRAFDDAARCVGSLRPGRDLPIGRGRGERRDPGSDRVLRPECSVAQQPVEAGPPGRGPVVEAIA
jgi:3-deoxy-D-manno-octulosonic acid (KDO) 8-phosphate synthase